MPRPIQVLDPRGWKAEDVVSTDAARAKAAEFPLPTLSGTSGKVVAILDNGWSAMNAIGPLVAEGLTARHGIGKAIFVPIPLIAPAPAETLAAVLDAADFAVVGLAN